MNSIQEEQFSRKGGQRVSVFFFMKEHLLQNIHNRDI